jgi:endonuclease YncB( thermonuclease family)
MSEPPGWFQDPQGPPGHLRWWDGRAWTEQRVAPPDTPVPAAWNPIRWGLRHPFSALVLAVVGAVVIAGIVDSAGEEVSLAGDTPAAGAPADPPGLAGDPGDEGVEVRDRPRRKSQPAPRTRAPEPDPRTYLVTRIVDGDTLELGNGEVVRLVGIDTPETGECGFEPAADSLARLVLGKPVTLGESDEDRDRYGRLLRYVDVGNQDAGLRLIKNGLAVARYDSRDGYGFHPRERVYVAADKGTRQFACAPKPRPFVQQPPAGGNCAPGYTPCVPAYPPDVNCPDVNGPIAVTGSDPHGLDADHDGVACE